MSNEKTSLSTRQYVRYINWTGARMMLDMYDTLHIYIIANITALQAFIERLFYSMFFSNIYDKS